MSDLLLERSAELAAIDRALRVALAGHARQLLVCGPPGSGRTALLEYARAGAHGLNVLAAAGEHGEQELPVRARPSPARAGRGRLDRSLRAPAGAQPRPGAKTPALIVIDDLQWCDPDSLRLAGVRGTAAAPHGARAGRGLGQRDDRIPRRDGAAAAAVQRARGRRRSCTSSSGTPSTPRFAAACHRETGGRPLLVHEVAVAARRNRVHETGGAEQWVASVVPPGVGRFLERRLATLPPAARALAGAIALLDAPAALHEAAALAGLGPDAAAAASDRLQHAGLLEGWTIAPAAARAGLVRRAPAGATRTDACARGPVRQRRAPPAATANHPRTRGSSTCCAAQRSRRSSGGSPARRPGCLRRAVREGVLDDAGAADARARARRAATGEPPGDRRSRSGSRARRAAGRRRGRARAGAADARAHAGGAGARARRRRPSCTPAPACCRAQARSHPRAWPPPAGTRRRCWRARRPRPCARRRAPRPPWRWLIERSRVRRQRRRGVPGRRTAPPARRRRAVGSIPNLLRSSWPVRRSPGRTSCRSPASTSSGRSRTPGASARSPGSCARETGLAAVALRAGDVEAAVVHATTALGAGRGTAAGRARARGPGAGVPGARPPRRRGHGLRRRHAGSCATPAGAAARALRARRRARRPADGRPPPRRRCTSRVPP